MNKKNVILIAGLVSDADTFSAQMKDLQDLANFQVPVWSKENTIDSIVDKILKNAPEKFYLAGHSMGGFLALEIMRHHQERVQALCVMTTSADVDAPDERKKREALNARAENGELDEIIEELADTFIFQTSSKPEILKMFMRNKSDFVRQRTAFLARKTCLPVLDKITVPTLVMAAKEDHTYFQSTCEIAENIPKAELVIIENSGHMLTMEQPKAASTWLRHWLEKS